MFSLVYTIITASPHHLLGLTAHQAHSSYRRESRHGTMVVQYSIVAAVERLASYHIHSLLSPSPKAMPTAAEIRAKIKANGDRMYGLYVGRRAGRGFRRFLNKHFFVIVFITAGMLLTWFLVPEFRVVEEKIGLFLKKLGAKTNQESNDHSHPAVHGSPSETEP